MRDDPVSPRFWHGSVPEVLSCSFHFEEDGFLNASPDHVTILHPDRLRALAEWIE